jgi:spoIIIJ-associated protein
VNEEKICFIIRKNQIKTKPCEVLLFLGKYHSIFYFVMENAVIVKELLTEILEKLNIEFLQIEVEEKESGVIRANIDTEFAPLLIGYHGENLEALQHILKAMLWNKGLQESIFVIVDVDNYKKFQEEKILDLAKEKADMVRETKIPQIMPPLSPAFRRLVHMELTAEKYSGIVTESEGEGSTKRVKILWREE